MQVQELARIFPHPAISSRQQGNLYCCCSSQILLQTQHIHHFENMMYTNDLLQPKIVACMRLDNSIECN